MTTAEVSRELSHGFSFSRKFTELLISIAQKEKNVDEKYDRRYGTTVLKQLNFKNLTGKKNRHLRSFKGFNNSRRRRQHTKLYYYKVDSKWKIY